MPVKTKETRTMTTPMEVREATTDKPATIEGYALKFNCDSEPMGWLTRFRERIDPHALDNADMTNAVALFNHDQNQILGRNGVNLELSVDDTGLKYVLTPPDTQLGRDLVENVRAGIISQSSFAFSITDDSDAEKWTRDGDAEAPYNRLIRMIDRIYDVSPVTTPAYPDTEVKLGTRSLDQLKALEQPPKWQQERQKMLNELKREDLLRGLF
nr:HK97 family phage prohead protease [Loigolactobacillus bifermentans]